MQQHSDVTHEQEIVILGLAAEVLEDALLPVPLHLIPVLNLTMANRVVDRVRLGVLQRLVADVKVQIVDTALGGEVSTTA